MPLRGSLSEIPGSEAAKVRRKSDIAYDAGHRRSNPIIGVDGEPPRKRRRSHPSGIRSPPGWCRYLCKLSRSTEGYIVAGFGRRRKHAEVILKRGFFGFSVRLRGGRGANRRWLDSPWFRVSVVSFGLKTTPLLISRT